MDNETAAILEIEGKQFNLLPGRNYLIGRLAQTGQKLDIGLRSENVDAKHAVVRVHHDQIKLLDLYSNSGTFWNGQRLEGLKEVTLERYGTLQFGTVVASLTETPKDTSNTEDNGLKPSISGSASVPSNVELINEGETILAMTNQQKTEKTSNIIDKNKVFFDNDSDKNSDALEFIAAQKGCQDFDKLLPHLTKNQMSPKREEVYAKMHLYNQSFTKLDKTQNNNRGDGNQIVVSRNRSHRHDAHDWNSDKIAETSIKLQPSNQPLAAKVPKTAKDRDINVIHTVSKNEKMEKDEATEMVSKTAKRKHDKLDVTVIKNDKRKHDRADETASKNHKRKHHKVDTTSSKNDKRKHDKSDETLSMNDKRKHVKLDETLSMNDTIKHYKLNESTIKK